MKRVNKYIKLGVVNYFQMENFNLLQWKNKTRIKIQFFNRKIQNRKKLMKNLLQIFYFIQLKTQSWILRNFKKFFMMENMTQLNLGKLFKVIFIIRIKNVSIFSMEYLLFLMKFKIIAYLWIFRIFKCKNLLLNMKILSICF
ncbi:hypothetical protein IMG5_005680 [Ichthyophthirius multifiliis]|uniref:Transmembrane protein n=1 Tax=Ichthyophthirius multifiliis TaxID=5932 RepID=G0QJI6_ICHMU|nr:hypothetical protein IMG5_005680 [Ichthyophthirius multifiliis]EGR34613.1 hypothetical protein IMG5_005680 [Ichthyophthirius multifiliis]|eukprot:XP_004039917.1 hypothetical protein IMG5_005680 [Ichthyophthirius multifiliis]